MKLPKTLLAAIVIGMAVQTTTSCSKDKEVPDPKKKEVKKEGAGSYPDSSRLAEWVNHLTCRQL